MEPLGLIARLLKYSENNPNAKQIDNNPSPNNSKLIMIKVIKQTNMFAGTKRLQMNESIDGSIQPSIRFGN
jgi:hypothetical protein